jgi:hypothetical protein
VPFPQCPRCGDNLSELVPFPREGGKEDVCTVCAAELNRPFVPPAPAEVDEVQAALARAAEPTDSMTVLDYFASQVAMGLAAKIGVPWHAENDGNPERVSRAAKKFGEQCYAIARGLAAARPKS